MARFSKTGDHAGRNDATGVLRPSKLQTVTNARKAVSTTGTSNDVRNREFSANSGGKLDVGTNYRAKSQEWLLAERKRLTGEERAHKPDRKGY